MFQEASREAWYSVPGCSCGCYYGYGHGYVIERPISKVERVSIDCRKTKTKVITLANKKGRRQSGKPIKLEVITRSRDKARENVHAQATIGFGFTSDWLKNRARTLNQSLSEVNAKPKQFANYLTFDTQLKTALENGFNPEVIYLDGIRSSE